jgi:hypothetical protein
MRNSEGNRGHGRKGGLLGICKSKGGDRRFIKGSKRYEYGQSILNTCFGMS